MADLQDLLHDLFLQEQLKAFKTKSHGMRWHLMMIRLDILIQSKSKAAYETLRKTGVLKLPGISALWEYVSATQPRVHISPWCEGGSFVRY